MERKIKPENKVILVFPAAQSRRPVSLDRNFPPMGITKLATRLKKTMPGRRVVLVDEAYHKLPEINPGDVVGLTSTTLNSARTAEIARSAKSAGAHVIVGGPHANHTSAQALAEVPEIDHVVTAHGEEALLGILRGELKDRVIHGTIPGRSLPEPMPDLTLWGSLAVYEEVFEKSVWAKEYADAIFLETQRGCTQSPRCSYCVRGPNGVKRVPHDVFWKVVSELQAARLGGIPSPRIPPRANARSGKLLVFDFSDEFMAMGRKKLQHLADSMPEGITDKVEFLAYARPDKIKSPEVAMLMQRVGVSKLSLGIESGDPDMLIRMNRKMSLEDHHRAVKFLSDTGIKIYLNMLIGGLDETLESLRSTVEHFRELVDVAGGMVYRAGARLVIPFPGSLDFRRMLDRFRGSGQSGLALKAEKYEHAFVMDPIELERDFLENCTSISMEDALDAHSEMMDIAKKHGIGMSDKPFLS